MTYLYAALGMAMLIPILISLEMSGALLQQELHKTSAAVNAGNLAETRELLEYLSELKEDKGTARDDLERELQRVPTYCDALEQWIAGKVSAVSVWSDLRFVTSQSDRCTGFSKAGMKVIILGSDHIGNSSSPPAPFEDFGVLTCDTNMHTDCGLEDG